MIETLMGQLELVVTGKSESDYQKISTIWANFESVVLSKLWREGENQWLASRIFSTSVKLATRFKMIDTKPAIPDHLNFDIETKNFVSSFLWKIRPDKIFMQE